MSWASKYLALSSSAIASSNAQISWALVSFRVGVVSTGFSVVVSLALVCVTIRTYLTDFYLCTRCTDTGVIVTHALSFYRPLAPLLLLTHAQLAVVTQSCALLYIAAHCDLLLQ